MKHLETQIEINASKEEVWKVLTDNNSYREWNPFIVQSSGTIQVGKTLVNSMKNGKKEMTFKPVVTEIQDQTRFEWLGSLLVKGIFDGRHYFELQEIDEGHTRFIQGEYFSGILSGLILSSIQEDTLTGFKAMNHALKQRVELNGKSN